MVLVARMLSEGRRDGDMDKYSLMKKRVGQ
jgi:hypothetical protein